MWGSLGRRVISAVRQPGAAERGGCGRDLRWGSRRLGRAGAGGCGVLRACSRLRGGGLCRIPLGTGAQRDLLEDQGEQERRCQLRDQVRVQGRERLGERGGDDMPEGAGSWARPCGVIELTCAALRWPAPDADTGRTWPLSSIRGVTSVT